MTNRREFFRGAAGGALATVAALLLPRDSRAIPIAELKHVPADGKKKVGMAVRPIMDKLAKDTKVQVQRDSAALSQAMLERLIWNGNFPYLFWDEPRWHPFERVDLTSDAMPEFPLDFVHGHSSANGRAYTIPNHGRIAERHVGGDYLVVPTYDLGASADWPMTDTLKKNYNITDQAFTGYIEALQNKLWYDEWCALLCAGADNPMSYEGLPNGRQIGHWNIRQLIEFNQLRNNHRFTDVAVGAHIFERAFGNKLPMATCEQCRVHKIGELGMMKPLWNLYRDSISGSPSEDDYQLALFIDNRHTDSFVTVVRDDLVTWPDDSMLKQERNGIYGWLESGIAILNGDNVLLGVFYEK
jgi:hypothetical protein